MRMRRKYKEIEDTLKIYLTGPILGIVMNSILTASLLDNTELLYILRNYFTDKLIKEMFPKLFEN
jgi:hypothetical protein